MIFLLMFVRRRAIFFLMVLFVMSCQSGENTYRTWQVYKGDPTSSSYSRLDQINKDNVTQLEVAWTYRTGDLTGDDPRNGIETNPIIVDDVMYGLSPYLKAFAVDAATGKEIWSFDPFKNDRGSGQGRSVVYWAGGDDQRILFSAGTWLYALNAETGKLISSFGREGRVSLNKGLGRDPDSISVRASSPGIVYQDLLIMGSAVGEHRNAAPGDIRAYDVRTGEIAWTFHTIPRPGEPGSETWDMDAESLKQQGGANNWAGMSVDKERGIVYIPLGSPVYDFYGGDRAGKNLYGNSLLALDAATGELLWNFQMVHHDLWDYDPPAPPNLLTIERDGKEIDAVAQITKHGFTFVFNRVTGEPVFPIEERPVPRSNIESEEAWPTQPFPTGPQPYVRQHLTADQVTDISPEARDSVLAELKAYRNEGMFTPPSFKGSILFPDKSGAARWGGAAHDPESGILYINANDLPRIAIAQTVKQSFSSEESPVVDKGRTFYVQNCASCHGVNLEGQPPTYPALRNIQQRRSKQEVLERIEEGGGMMPAFQGISKEKKDAIVDYLFNRDINSNRVAEDHNYSNEMVAGGNGQYTINVKTPYFQDPHGHPAIKPPWGTLNAIDLNSGKIKWKVPLGGNPELAKQGIPPTGMPSWGGPIVTAGGLIFIGGTVDQKLRAFDKETGKLLWETTLPAAGFATPSTYMSGGRQYVVIAAGGGRGSKPGDYYVAFALPE